MKRLIALMVTACALTSVMAAPNVGVSIGINQPGVYGRIDIGNGHYGAPQVVYPQPVIIAPPTVVYQRRPIYMYVPPSHQRHWGRYCGRYQACGQPVYFVQDQWVRHRWQQEHPNDGRRGWDQRRDHHGHDHDDHDHDHDHDHGRRNGRGHGRD